MMSPSERYAADGTSTEARARSREAAEQLAVRLRWLSIGAIPVLAHVSGDPVRSPWFELSIAGAALYNLVVTYVLGRGHREAALSVGTAITDCAFLLLLCWLSGGINSSITTYDYLAMVTVCMRLPFLPALGVGALYAAQLALLAWIDGSLWGGQVLVKTAYVFLTVVFVSPVVEDSRERFAEVLAGHRAQRMLLHRLLRTGEDERRRVARELHDRGGGALFSLLHGLRRLRDVVHPCDAAAEAEVDRLIQVTEATVHDLRVLLADLRPRLLDDLGLAEALRELLTRERALSGIPVSFEVETTELPDSESALALYRVAQEAFTNIRRHARAGAANVRLAQDESGWLLAVEDDGKGLNGNRTGLGLRTMRERVEALGGRLDIDSAPGAGTKIRAWVPQSQSGERDGDSSLSR
jgi:signal transduction histidine kinase